MEENQNPDEQKSRAGRKKIDPLDKKIQLCVYPSVRIVKEAGGSEAFQEELRWYYENKYPDKRVG